MCFWNIIIICDNNGIVKDILDAKAVLFGIPTIYDEPYPSIGDIIYYLKGLKFNRTGFKRLAIAFGSMGGEGGAVAKIAEESSKCGFEVIDQYELYYVPTEDELTNCYNMGKELAKRIKEMKIE